MYLIFQKETYNFCVFISPTALFNSLFFLSLITSHCPIFWFVAHKGICILSQDILSHLGIAITVNYSCPQRDVYLIIQHSYYMTYITWHSNLHDWPWPTNNKTRLRLTVRPSVKLASGHMSTPGPVHLFNSSHAVLVCTVIWRLCLHMSHIWSCPNQSAGQHNHLAGISN